MTTIDYTDFVNKHYDRDENNIEVVISGMRNTGASQIQCVKALMSIGFSLKEADSLVINSIAWKEEKENAEKFRNDLGVFLENLE